MTHPSEIPCPKCGAKPGRPCVFRGVTIRTMHKARCLMVEVPRLGEVHPHAKPEGVQQELFPNFVSSRRRSRRAR
jgi:hypothetical protein